MDVGCREGHLKRLLPEHSGCDLVAGEHVSYVSDFQSIGLFSRLLGPQLMSECVVGGFVRPGRSRVIEAALPAAAL